MRRLAGRRKSGRWGQVEPVALLTTQAHTMRVLLINPRCPNTLWNFSGISELTGASMGQTPLGLATVAALTPQEHQVTIVDENIESIDFDIDADLVAIGAFTVQVRRAIEISQRLCARVIPTAIGGP